MHDIFDYLHSLPLLSQVLLAVLLLLFAAFISCFVIRGLFLWLRLRQLRRRLRIIGNADLDSLAGLFAADPLRHLWSEFAETLHRQTAPDPRTGSEKTVAFRSTVPAGAFFNAATLVEGRLLTEFFKHVPGIFTGIGIIGTFGGLITGLRAFQISEEPSVVRESLNLLLHGVHEAFLVSAAAIGLAIGVTLIEKIMLAALHRQVEELSQRLDGLFEAGAGEEYLARLVRASEESSSQTRVLKDALVGDLKDILGELADRQIAAVKSGNIELAERITSSLENGLKEPLGQVVSAVHAIGQQRGDAINDLLTNVLVSFSQRLEDLFGGQIAGINQLQQQTVQSLEAAIVGLQQMVAGIEDASRNSSEALAGKLGEAIGAMEVRQRAMNEQMAQFVEDIHALVGKSQDETGEKLQTILGAIGERFETTVSALQKHAQDAADAHAARESRITSQTENVVADLGTHVDTLLTKTTEQMNEFGKQIGGLLSHFQKESGDKLETTLGAIGERLDTTVGALQKHAEDAADAHAARESRLASQTQDVMAKFGNQLDGLSAQITEAVASMRADIEAMSTATADVIRRMTSGAETLLVASGDFARAGQSVSGVLEKTSAVSAQLAQSAASVSATTRSLQGMLSEQQAVREAIAQLVSSLEASVANARKEAALTADVLHRIEGATVKLNQAQYDADQYLEKVSGVLAEAHEQFASNIQNTLGQANTAFFEQLNRAVNLLRVAIEEFEASLGHTPQMAA